MEINYNSTENKTKGFFFFLLRIQINYDNSINSLRK